MRADAVHSKGTSLPPRSGVSSAGSLFCSLRAASKLASLRQSMLLVLSFAETSSASEPISLGDNEVPSEFEAVNSGF